MVDGLGRPYARSTSDPIPQDRAVATAVLMLFALPGFVELLDYAGARLRRATALVVNASRDTAY
jgi:hypothetical protein